MFELYDKTTLASESGASTIDLHNNGKHGRLNAMEKLRKKQPVHMKARL
jgi:hypothetical protein